MEGFVLSDSFVKFDGLDDLIALVIVVVVVCNGVDEKFQDCLCN